MFSFSITLVHADPQSAGRWRCKRRRQCSRNRRWVVCRSSELGNLLVENDRWKRCIGTTRINGSPEALKRRASGLEYRRPTSARPRMRERRAASATSSATSSAARPAAAMTAPRTAPILIQRFVAAARAAASVIPAVAVAAAATAVAPAMASMTTATAVAPAMAVATVTKTTAVSAVSAAAGAAGDVCSARSARRPAPVRPPTHWVLRASARLGVPESRYREVQQSLERGATRRDAARACVFGPAGELRSCGPLERDGAAEACEQRLSPSCQAVSSLRVPERALEAFSRLSLSLSQERDSLSLSLSLSLERARKRRRSSLCCEVQFVSLSGRVRRGASRASSFVRACAKIYISGESRLRTSPRAEEGTSLAVLKTLGGGCRARCRRSAGL